MVNLSLETFVDKLKFIISRYRQVKYCQFGVSPVNHSDSVCKKPSSGRISD